MAHLNTQPFGSRRAPANWGRLTQFVAFVLTKIYRIWVGLYADDVFCVEPEGTIAPAKSAIKSLREVLGMGIDPDKEVGPAVSDIPLGVGWAGGLKLSKVVAHAILRSEKK